MLPWLQILLALCVVAITIALVPTLLALRRTSERAERVLALAEQELRPLVDELRELSRQARGEMVRVGALTERVEDVAEGLGRVLSAVSGLTRAGQLVGVAAGLKTGLDVFLHRLRRNQGENHE